MSSPYLEKPLPFIITTDGIENASHLYTYEKVKTMIERQKEKCSWEFIFLGTNIDAVEVADSRGINEDRVANYHCDEEGSALNYEVLSEALCQIRMGCELLSADWERKLMKIFKIENKREVANG